MRLARPLYKCGRSCNGGCPRGAMASLGSGLGIWTGIKTLVQGEIPANFPVVMVNTLRHHECLSDNTYDLSDAYGILNVYAQQYCKALRYPVPHNETSTYGTNACTSVGVPVFIRISWTTMDAANHSYDQVCGDFLPSNKRFSDMGTRRASLAGPHTAEGWRHRTESGPRPIPMWKLQ